VTSGLMPVNKNEPSLNIVLNQRKKETRGRDQLNGLFQKLFGKIGSFRSLEWLFVRGMVRVASLACASGLYCLRVGIVFLARRACIACESGLYCLRVGIVLVASRDCISCESGLYFLRREGRLPLNALRDYNADSQRSPPISHRSLLTPKQWSIVNPSSSMSRFLFLAFSPLIGIILSTQVQSQEDKQDPGLRRMEAMDKVFEPREFVGSNKNALKYRMIKPIGYLAGKKYPLVLFLHGAGERGSDNKITLVHAASEFADETRRKQYPCYVVIPQCPEGQKWSDVDWTKESSDQPEVASPSMQTIKELLDEMVDSAGIDLNRIYITGLSMGGYGTWDAIARYPGFFAAAAPVCGGGDPKTVKIFAKLPIWCFHGADDSVVKAIRSQEMVSALKAVGSQVKYTEYPGVEHDSWTETYANPAFYEWLFAQVKPK
jgi:poly(3-hydroxybutyrate) depolymerase